MTENAHYFLAIPIPNELKPWVKEQQQHFLQSSKLIYKHVVDKEDFHITLKFFGPISLAKKKLLVDDLKQIKNSEPFELEIGSIGYFGSPNRPRVCWLGVGQDDQLSNLYKRIESIAETHGYQPEKRAYSPHITLAKKWRAGHLEEQDWKQKIIHLNEKKRFKVDSFKLYRVAPKQKPMYQTIETFKLV